MGLALHAARLSLRGLGGRDARHQTILQTYNELILARNSRVDPAVARRSISNSMASTGDSGFSTLRSTQMRCKSSFGISSSSLRVPERRSEEHTSELQSLRH